MSDTSHTQDTHGKPEKNYDIIVNTHPKTVPSDHVTYDEIITLAMGANYPNPTETLVVTFDEAVGPRHEGVMSQGDVVRVKEGTIFSVETSNKS